MRVAIFIRGGNVCEVLSDNPDIVVTIIDFNRIAEDPDWHPYNASTTTVTDISKEIFERDPWWMRARNAEEYWELAEKHVNDGL